MEVGGGPYFTLMKEPPVPTGQKAGWGPLEQRKTPAPATSNSVTCLPVYV